MSDGQYEVVVLKPTKVFFAFLASQLPESQWPSLKLLQTDNTAYVIPKYNSNKETLEALQRHYSSLFRYEISRWLGKEARNSMENNALDFLCCFKFELHNHIILMEPTLQQGQQLLIIKPRSTLLDWLKSTLEEEEGLSELLEQVQLSHLVENATVLVKNFASLKDIQPFLRTYYHTIFESAMCRMTGEKEQWPVVDSFSSFNHYFSIEIHTQLKHLL